MQQGTATIVDNTIVYEPPHDFTGEDGFVYTVQDGAGNVAAAPVSLLVQQFSDINNNGINDFVECDCDDIRLITGVDGTGTGSAFYLFLLMLGFFIIRARLQVLKAHA